ncbi:MAG TPA: lysylphosphatidylglycerol synthase domain-containing protein [Terriglobia bacterium]|nr:lysylphosphatidylglycerol synthase domain-containing protein [Terriglobia bacterium]
MFKRKLKLLTLLICAGLFALLIAQTGPAIIASRVYDVGLGFLLLIVISGVRHLLRTAAWYFAIEPQARRVRFRDLFGMRIAGEAITDLTVLGPLLGETVKGVTLSRQITPEHSASSVVIENLAYSFAVGLFVVSGLILFIAEFPSHSSMRAGALITLASLLLAGSLIAFIVKKRYRLVSRSLDGLKKLNLRWLDGLQEGRAKVAAFEENVYDFWHGHRAAAALILMLETLSICVGVVEAWIILVLTVHRASFFAAFMVETVNRVVNLFFAFIPMRIGVDEGGAALVLRTVGFGAVEGVSLAIIRKIRTLFWVALGLVLVGRYAMVSKKETPTSSSVAAASK